MSKCDELDWKRWRVFARAEALRNGAGDSASDIAQQAMTNTIKQPAKAHTLRYLITAVRNQCKLRWRRRQRCREVLVDPASIDPGCSSVESNPLRRLMVREQFEELERKLMPDEMQALVLRHLKNLYYDEISLEMGRSVSAVKGLLTRARRKAREVLIRYGRQID